MPPAPARPKYRRFPGTGSYALARITLYIAEDHLLQLAANGFTETYRRFFFQDIQALSLYRTPLGMIVNILTGGLALMFGLVAAATLASGVASVAVSFGIVTVICAVGLVWNLAAGPTCICVIQTAVRPQRLYSVLRIKRAMKLINQLRPLILAAQTSGAGAATSERSANGPV